jgi:hypothetical protein
LYATEGNLGTYHSNHGGMPNERQRQYR